MQSDPVLQAALEYAGYGWRVIALKGQRSKRPVIPNWQAAATTDEDTICRWWGEIPKRNCGVVMGPTSGIIDIECDAKSPAQLAELEQVVVKIFGGELPTTPSFKSRRGRHWILKWRDDLPFAESNMKFEIKTDAGTVEFRTGGGNKGCQSVFPPSQHPDGPTYTWVPGLSPGETDLAEIDDATMARIWVYLSEGGVEEPTEHTARPPEYWQTLAKGVSEGSRNESEAAYVGKLLSDLADDAVFDDEKIELHWQTVVRWNDDCKPPQKVADLRKTFESILRRDRMDRINKNQRVNGKSDQQYTTRHDGEIDTQWRLVIKDVHPRVYYLHSPLWACKTSGGPITLSAAQMHNASLVRCEALEQADTWIPKSFDKLWHGSKDDASLASQLIDAAEFT